MFFSVPLGSMLASMLALMKPGVIVVISASGAAAEAVAAKASVAMTESRTSRAAERQPHGAPIPTGGAAARVARAPGKVWPRPLAWAEIDPADDAFAWRVTWRSLLSLSPDPPFPMRPTIELYFLGAPRPLYGSDPCPLPRRDEALVPDMK